MDRTTTLGGDTSDASPLNPSNTANSKSESAAQTAHRTVDSVADKATAQVDRLSGSAHRAVNSAADAAGSAAQWASSIPEQAKQTQVRLTEAACTSIRARPISTVVGALVIGYLLGRIARS
ncbi:MAG TPA: hypothetical protein VGK44_19210 [Casimicrobiaceae bacterium]|jgi:hypothetical protein